LWESVNSLDAWTLNLAPISASFKALLMVDYLVAADGRVVPVEVKAAAPRLSGSSRSRSAWPGRSSAWQTRGCRFPGWDVANRDETAKNVTIRLSLADLERARRQAERRGLRYQTYVKMLLHQALVADARRLA
jgi:hypothetical protein